MVRSSGSLTRASLLKELPFIELVEGDLADQASLTAAVDYASPDEVYNLGGASFVSTSFAEPEVTADVTGLGEAPP